MYRTFADNAPNQAPWIWNATLSAPAAKSTPARIPENRGDGRYSGYYEHCSKRRNREEREVRDGADQDDGRVNWRGTLRGWGNTSPLFNRTFSTGKIFSDTTQDEEDFMKASNPNDAGGGVVKSATADTSIQARMTLEAGELSAGQEVPNLLHTLKVGDLNQYAFKCPPGQDPNQTTIPGVYLPNIMRTSQGLFGVAANKCGTSQKLAYLSKSVPGWAPRFLTVDTLACSSSVVSNFRKTKVQYVDNNDPDRMITKYTRDYEPVPAGWECAACGPPNPHVKPYGRYKRALEAAARDHATQKSLRSSLQRASSYSSCY